MAVMLGHNCAKLGLFSYRLPVLAACVLQAHCRPRMHPLYVCCKDVNMDDNSEFLNLSNAVVGGNIL